MLVPVLVGLGIAGLIWAWKNKTTAPSIIVPLAPVVVQTPTGPVVTTAPVGPPVVIPPTQTPPSSGGTTAGRVQTPPTIIEPALDLRLIEPDKQPKVQAGAKQDQARAQAPQLDAALKGNVDGANYPTKNPQLKSQVSTFQGLTGLTQDGLYGPQTAGALMFYLGQPPPPPFFYSGERVIKVFRPTP